MISGDVITDIDLTEISDFHERARGDGHHRARPRSPNPLEFGIVITRDDGSIERFLEKPTWGQVFSDTINTGIYVLEPEIFDYIPDGRSVDFSGEVFPRLLADGPAAVRRRSPRATGRTSARSTPTSRAHKDVLDETGRARHPRLPGERRRLARRGRRDLARRRGRSARPSIGPGSQGRGGLPARRVHRARLQRAAAVATSTSNAPSLHDNVYVGNGVRLRGAVIGRSCSIRSNVRVDEGVVLGDEVFVGADAVVAGDVKVYPFKTIEDGAVVNSSIVWESKGARSLFGRDGVTGLANVDITPELAAKLAMAYGTSLRKGSPVVTSRDSSRAGPHAEAGDHGRAQRRRHRRARPRGGEHAGHPLPRAVAPSHRRADGAARTRRPRAGASSGSSTTPAPTSPRTPSARSSACSSGRTTAGCIPEEIGDIEFPHRALEDYTVSLSATVEPGAIAERRLQARRRLRLRRDVVRDAERAGQARRRRARREPVRVDAGPHAVRPEGGGRAGRRLVRASGAHLGAVFDPDGERLVLVDDEGDVLTDTEALLAFVELVCDHLLGDRIALPVNITDHARRIAESHGVGVTDTKMSTAALMAAATEPGVGFAADGRGGFILPGFLPAFDAAAALVKMLDLLARSGRELSTVRDAAAQGPHGHTRPSSRPGSRRGW